MYWLKFIELRHVDIENVEYESVCDAQSLYTLVLIGRQIQTLVSIN